MYQNTEEPQSLSHLLPSINFSPTSLLLSQRLRQNRRVKGDAPSGGSFPCASPWLTGAEQGWRAKNTPFRHNGLSQMLSSSCKCWKEGRKAVINPQRCPKFFWVLLKPLQSWCLLRATVVVLWRVKCRVAEKDRFLSAEKLPKISLDFKENSPVTQRVGRLKSDSDFP